MLVNIDTHININMQYDPCDAFVNHFYLFVMLTLLSHEQVFIHIYMHC